MPAASLVERRNCAVLAFAVVTGARAAALASFRLGDVDADEGWVDQDARHVKTKFSKTFRTILMPVSPIAMKIALEWHAEMTADARRGPHGPLFQPLRWRLERQAPSRRPAWGCEAGTAADPCECPAGRI